jgi:peptidyl-prolyl cis-trans isomerase B (cyclophilin B)
VRVTAAPPSGPPPRNRTGVVVGIVLAVVLVLCLCSVGAVVYFARRVDWNNLTGDGGQPSTTSSGQQPAAPLDCRVGEHKGNAKDVGRPDFAAAPRTGQATMTITTNLGGIVIGMDRAKTPCTVASFAHLAGKKFFDGTTCHRLVTDGIFIL